jgi:hypothetical protein
LIKDGVNVNSSARTRNKAPFLPCREAMRTQLKRADLLKNRDPGLLSALMIAVIRGYQTYISGDAAQSCRFQPTCSQYAVERSKNTAQSRRAAWRSGASSAAIRSARAAMIPSSNDFYMFQSFEQQERRKRFSGVAFFEI